MPKIISGYINSILYEGEKISLEIDGKYYRLAFLSEEPEFRPGDWCRAQVYEKYIKVLEVEGDRVRVYHWKSSAGVHMRPTFKQYLNRFLKRHEIHQLERELTMAGDRRDWNACDATEAKLYALTGYAHYSPLDRETGS